MEVLKNTKSLCMESNTHANIAVNQATTNGSLKEHQNSVHDEVKYSCKVCSYLVTTNESQNTKGMCMMESNTHANIAAIKQPKREI